MPYFVAVDIGGTFTDLVAYDFDAAAVRFTKSPTTYGNFVDGIMDCMRKVGISPSEIQFANHGTTLVINALIQRRGAKAALLTTTGFRDVLEIARGNRPIPFDLHYQRDEPLIPRELRFEVDERIGAGGEVITPLDDAGIERVSKVLADKKVEAIAISFLNSYLNPAHEERAEQLLRTLLPGVYITRGSDLSREWYEYERCSTVAANAFVGPQVAGYVGSLESELRKGGFDGTLFLMGSNGGVLSVERSCRQPIALVESGPIGGCIGAGEYAKALGFPNVIAFDMGGTTAKSALVQEGRFSVEQIYYAGGYAQGFPMKSPVIDIIEVGSGGGSIAWLDGQKRLHVGPESAGSTPGPVCYHNGGTEPTVTDANLILGRLAADRFLGGEMMLDLPAAVTAMLDRVAKPLGYDGEAGAVAMAQGIVSIATVVMASAIRKRTVEHGRDPRDFVLFAYGGNGPLHAVALARELSIPTVVVPPEPGNFSASGMLIADARLDTSQTFTGKLDEAITAAVDEAFLAMEATAAEAIRREIKADAVTFERQLEMRYRGQRHNIKVAITNLSNPAAIRDAFERDYRRRYGHSDDRAAVEIQALHLSAVARLRRPELGRMARPQSAGSPARGTRKVYFEQGQGPIETPVFDRFALSHGFSGIGPAVIEEYGSTTIVWPGDRFEIGTLGEIRIDCKQAN